MMPQRIRPPRRGSRVEVAGTVVDVLTGALIGRSSMDNKSLIVNLPVVKFIPLATDCQLVPRVN
jgi:hypothetical protein